MQIKKWYKIYLYKIVRFRTLANIKQWMGDGNKIEEKIDIERRIDAPPKIEKYLLLIITSIYFISIAFFIAPDITELLLNLATELLGVVVILIVLEERYSKSEVDEIQVLFRRILGNRNKIFKKYLNQIENNGPDTSLYVSRAEI